MFLSSCTRGGGSRWRGSTAAAVATRRLRLVGKPSEPASVRVFQLLSAGSRPAGGWLTIDPFGLWVVGLELGFEEILHGQLGVASRLVVDCEKENRKSWTVDVERSRRIPSKSDCLQVKNRPGSSGQPLVRHHLAKFTFYWSQPDLM